MQFGKGRIKDKLSVQFQGLLYSYINQDYGNGGGLNTQANRVENPEIYVHYLNNLN